MLCVVAEWGDGLYAVVSPWEGFGYPSLQALDADAGEHLRVRATQKAAQTLTLSRRPGVVPCIPDAEWGALMVLVNLSDAERAALRNGTDAEGKLRWLDTEARAAIKEVYAHHASCACGW